MRRVGMLLLLSGLTLSASRLAVAQTLAPAATNPAIGPAPAAPSYLGVERAIVQASEALKGTGPGAAEHAPGWNTLFAGLRSELAAHKSANTTAERLASLEKLARYERALAVTAWEPGYGIRAALIGWIQPRLRLETAVQSLQGVVGGASVSTQDATNRREWTQFVDKYLADSLKAYETSQTVQARHQSLVRLQTALAALDKSATGWAPSAELTEAVRAFHRHPNLEVTIDPSILARYLARELVQTGPVLRKGYVSQVTAGPYLGFGLLPSDIGIAFFNRQAFTTYTPITDFQQKLEADDQGRKIAKLYCFTAASTDAPVLTVSSIISPSGLQLFSSYEHSVDAVIGSAKQPGHGLQRGVLALIGLNEPKLNQKVHDNGIGEIRSNVVSEAAQESAERMAVAAAEQNAKLASILIGNRTAVVRDIEITQLDMRSRPDQALAIGNVGWRDNDIQLGADFAQPPQLLSPEPGVAADVHLGSIMSNLARGYWRTQNARNVTNILVKTKAISPGEPASNAVSATPNATFADFSAAVNAARAANNPKVNAIWVKKPNAPPSFGVDARGYLVALVPDFQIDLPVPAQFASAANNARIFRLQSPLAEFVLDVKVKPGKTPSEPLEFTGKVIEFHPGPGSKVLAITEDESKATPLDPFRSVFVLQGFGRILGAQPINLPLSQVKLPGYAVKSVSDLDPSGWLRVVLMPAPEGTIAPAAASTAPATSPAPASASTLPPTPPTAG